MPDFRGMKWTLEGVVFVVVVIGGGGGGGGGGWVHFGL